MEPASELAITTTRIGASMILLVAVSAMATVGAAPINWCNNVETADEQEMAKLITKTMPYLKSACYFVVERGLEGALIGSSEFRRFQIQNARETCKKFGASLPSVQSADENKFLSQIGKYVVLGLQAQLPDNQPIALRHSRNDSRPVILKWDDGSESRFRPEHWFSPRGEPVEMITILMPLLGDWRTISATDRRFFERMTVVCKVALNTEPTTTTSNAAATLDSINTFPLLFGGLAIITKINVRT